MSENWYPSKWGSDDEIGALNEITLSHVVDAAKLVKSGKVYSLAQVTEFGIPVHPFHGQFLYSTFRRHSEDLKSPGKKNQAGGMNVRLEMADHTGTHIDGLNHVSIGEKLYNGVVSKDVVGTFGSSKLGIEKTPPIVTRGLFIDVPSLNGLDTLEPGHAISKNELLESLKNSGQEVRAGDAVLIATGWGRLWMKDNAKFSGPVPGIDISAAEWLAEHGVVLVGSDTWNVEVDAEGNVGADAVHMHLLAKKGVRLIENMFLEELRRDKVKEHLFVCLPLKIRGGTGSPVSPIAVV